MKKALLLLIVLQITCAYADIDSAANFYLDYKEYFGVTPKFVLFDENIHNLEETFVLFSAHLKDQPIVEGSSHGCVIHRSDLIRASALIDEFIDEHGSLPKIISIRDCRISATEFLDLAAKAIVQKKDHFSVEKEFLEDITVWDAERTDKYVEFTLDYEKDRPAWGSFDPDEKVFFGDSIVINPNYLDPVCFNETCPLQVSSKELAWSTAIMHDHRINYPKCYPYCGVIKATRLILDFSERYDIPLSFDLTGDSIIVIINNSLLKLIKNSSLISLGMHSMHHENLKMISHEKMIRSLDENYRIFRLAFEKDPIQFRAPYVMYPDTYRSETLEEYGIKVDNGPMEICPLCKHGNYEKIPNSTIRFVSIDWELHPDDALLNFYPSHPWEFIYEEQGNPVYLVESDTSAHDIFSRWMYLIGELGYVPTNPERELR